MPLDKGWVICMTLNSQSVQWNDENTVLWGQNEKGKCYESDCLAMIWMTLG